MINKRLAGELFMRLRGVSTDAHVEHLKTDSFARHKALDEFYHEVIDDADGFAETCQGALGSRLEYAPIPQAIEKSIENALRDIKDWIDANYDNISDETHIHNILDEIKSLIDSTREHLSRK